MKMVTCAMSVQIAPPVAAAPLAPKAPTVQTAPQVQPYKPVPAAKSKRSALKAAMRLAALGRDAEAAPLFLRAGAFDAALRRYEQAIAICNRALQLDAHRTDARESLASALAQTGQLDEAARQYEVVLNQEPLSAEALTGLGLIYMAQGRADHAVEAYREALRVRPDDAEAHNDLGVALVRQGNVAEGIAHLEEAVRERPLQAEYRANLEAARGLRR